MQKRKTLELYFHIPFCVKKCLYCDFLSAPADDVTKRDYMEALLTEMVGSAEQYQDYIVDTVFIGGGTPSAVDAVYIERLLDGVREHYCISEAAEITIEVNPGTVDAEKLCRYRKAGVNRLSIGMQSAHNDELKAIGRIHTWEQFADTYAGARRAGFDNINVDIMSALPGQSMESYRNTLKKVLSLKPRPEHISAYSLILEEETPFYEKYERGELDLPDEETDRRMYSETKEMLAAAGYRRYEISNYAMPGRECRHNVGYWRRTNYVGFGIGAASLVENVRFCNGSDISAYIKAPCGCREALQPLEVSEQMEEFMFLGLRLTDGVSFVEFEQLFGKTPEAVYGDVIEKNVRDGLLRILPALESVTAGDAETGHGIERKIVGKAEERDLLRLALTEKGLDVSNYVMAQFLL